MCIGITGDANDVTPEECAVRLASAGADVVGINCNLDPISSLKTIAKMKDGLAAAGLNPFLMMQPCGFHSQDVETSKRGFYDLPEYPFLIEPRLITRVDCYEYARKAFELGVRYIGGCCGFEPYHIRAVALELEKETGKKPPGGRHVSKWGESAKHGAVGHERTGQEYWTSVVPGIGRPKIKPFSPGLT
jgi:betaine-homocysteine S-methyltransferase